jgi:hypothetical protein
MVTVFATHVAIYAFWICPILASRPAFHELYDKDQNFIAALRETLNPPNSTRAKFTLSQRILGVLIPN